MLTLSSCLIWQIISFILSPNEYGCVYAWTKVGNIATDRLTEDADFGKKKSFFQMKLILILASMETRKIVAFGAQKSARIHWKADAPKTSHYLVWILIQRHNWDIFLRKWADNGDRYRAILNEFLFTKIEEEDIGKIWFQQDGATCHTAETTLDVLRPIFEDRIISRRDDVVWLPRDCDLKPLEYYLWGAVKDKCGADKPRTIDALKDNICEAIDEIQLHTMDIVLKNSTDRVGYCMASRASHLNEIIFHY